VRSRRGPDGRALEPLTQAELRRAIAALRAAHPESVAIGLLHAYAAREDERRLARAARRLGVPVSVSSELCPEIREYERLATTVVNAYLEPRVAGYLEAIGRACGPGLEIVLSHGGGAPVREAAREPVRQLLSGPAAGLWAAVRAARRAGFARALTLDVGGTSTDVAYAEERLPRRRAREIAGFPILLPLLDVHTVGAGGGSIAAVDAGGLLAVGPSSAGADPGPACYGGGGPATVTDALVTLGRLPARSLGDGAIAIDSERARAAMAALAPALGLRSAEAGAAAVLAVANARMEAALRRVSVERGNDPRGAALVAFGGAGGLHACELAEDLGVDAVVFPAFAGMLSALGALASPRRVARSRTVLRSSADHAALARVVEELEREVRGRLGRGRSRVERIALARYRGQSHELEIPYGPSLAGRFHALHARRHGFARVDAAVEVVTLEVEGSIEVEAPPAAARPRRRRSVASESARVSIGGRPRAVPVLDFESLAGGRLVGPAIVLQSGATLWIPQAWSGRMHASGALVLRRRSA
jgi:N-methylhydantoinase A